MQSYDYANRDGVKPISWEEFGRLAARLAELVEPRRPDLVLGLARGGLFPATAVACALRTEFYPIRLTRRDHDIVVRAHPEWRTPPPASVTGRRVVLIDEMVDSGETLRIAAEEIRRLGASEVITAALVSHSWAAPPPDIVALVTDALVLFPWDRRVLIDGVWQDHPELVEALAAQAKASDPDAQG